jgi:hypothetical protein
MDPKLRHPFQLTTSDPRTMKLLIVAAVVLMAVVGSSDGLKCFTCGEEDSDKCQDGQTSKECPAEEAGAVSSINCYATEICKFISHLQSSSYVCMYVVGQQRSEPTVWNFKSLCFKKI